MVLQNMGRFNDSLQPLDQAIELNSRFAKAWNLKGLALLDQNNNEEALTCFEKATGLEPNNKAFQDNKNEALKVLRRNPELKIEFPKTG
jgi:tetratricopeptide (TPR) repeat protein